MLKPSFIYCVASYQEQPGRAEQVIDIVRYHHIQIWEQRDAAYDPRLFPTKTRRVFSILALAGRCAAGSDLICQKL